MVRTLPSVLPHDRPTIGRRIRTALVAACASAALSLVLPAAFAEAATLHITDGSLTYTGSSGANSLTVSVSGGTYTFTDAAEAITLTGMTTGWSGNGTTSVSGPDSSVNAINLNLGDGADTVNLRSANDPVTVNGELGTDTINVSSNAPSNTGTLSGIAANVIVHGDAGSDSVVVSDYSAASGNGSVVVTDSSITGLAGPTDGSTISYTGTFSRVRVITSNTPGLSEGITVSNTSTPLQVDTNAGSDSIAVRATSNPTTINAGAGNDQLTVSSNPDLFLSTLDSIHGTLTIDAGAGANTLVLGDFAASGPNTVVVTNTSVTGLAPAAISYKAVGGSFSNLEMDGAGTWADTFTFNPLSTSTTLNVYGNGGDDLFAVNGNLKGTLTGGAGDDAFSLAPGKILTGTLDGGLGSDWMNFASHTTGVNVDLATGSAPGVTAGVSGIENVIGGSGGDQLTAALGGGILIGNDGEDHLTGGDGKDLLVGGAGADMVAGAGADDILIGSSTVYDADTAKLQAIGYDLSAAADINAAIAAINASGSDHALEGSTVLDDGTSDQVIGDGDDDWFLGFSDDVLSDVSGGDVVTVL